MPRFTTAERRGTTILLIVLVAALLAGGYLSGSFSRSDSPRPTAATAGLTTDVATDSAGLTRADNPDSITLPKSKRAKKSALKPKAAPTGRQRHHLDEPI